MMDWTDRHDRFFLRLITRRALLYTEMVTTGAVLHGDRARLLGFDASEHPVAVQLGGSEPADLADHVLIFHEYGTEELGRGSEYDYKDGRETEDEHEGVSQDDLFKVLVALACKVLERNTSDE